MVGAAAVTCWLITFVACRPQAVAWIFTATGADMDLSFSSVGDAALRPWTMSRSQRPRSRAQSCCSGSALGGMGFLGYRRKKIEAAA
jgi:hypothetical protein